MGHPERMGLAYGWDEATFIARSRTTRARRHGVPEPVHRLRPLPRGGAGTGAGGGPRAPARGARGARRGAAEADLDDRPGERMTPRVVRTMAAALAAGLALALAAPPALAQSAAWPDIVARARGQTRQLERLGRRREDQRLHRLGRRGSRAPLRREGQSRQAQGHGGGGDAGPRRKGRRPRPRRQRRPDLDQRPELRRAEAAGAAVRPVRARASELRAGRHRRQAVERRRLHASRRRLRSRPGGWRRSCSSTTGRASLRSPRSIPELLDWAQAPSRALHASGGAQLPRHDVPEAGALRARAGPGGAAAAGDRRELRRGDRAAVDLVRRAEAPAVAPGRAVPRQRPGAAAAPERRRDRHDGLVQPGRGRGVDPRRPAARHRCAPSSSPRGTIGNTSFVAIPYNAAHKEGAMVVANFLLDPATQAKAQDHRQMGNFTVLDLARLSAAERRHFDELPRHPALPTNAELGRQLLGAAPVVDDAHHRRMGASVHEVTFAGPGGDRTRRRGAIAWAPVLTSGAFLLPVGAGLAGTLLPAFGYLPALGGTGLSLDPWRTLFGAARRRDRHRADARHGLRRDGALGRAGLRPVRACVRAPLGAPHRRVARAAARHAAFGAGAGLRLPDRSVGLDRACGLAVAHAAGRSRPTSRPSVTRRASRWCSRCC